MQRMCHDVNITSPQRRCNVMTLHRRWGDVIFTSCARWDCTVNCLTVNIIVFVYVLYSNKILSTKIYYVIQPLPPSGQIQKTTNWCYFIYFPKKIDFDISCKLSPKETLCVNCRRLFPRKQTDVSCSPKETICMNCQRLFSGKIRKNISKYHLLKFLSNLLSVNKHLTDRSVGGTCALQFFEPWLLWKSNPA